MSRPPNHQRSYSSNTPIVYQVRARRHSDTDSDSGDESIDDENIPNHRRRRVRVPLQNITGLAHSAMLAGDRVNQDTPTTMAESESRLRHRINMENNRRRSEALTSLTRHGNVSDEGLLYISRRHPNQTRSVQNQLIGRENRDIYYEPENQESFESENNRMTRQERRGNRRRNRAEMEGIGIQGKNTAYCVKCKSKRQIMNPHEVTIANGRKCLKGVCGECGTKLTRFI